LPLDQEIKHLVIWLSGHLVIDCEIGTSDECRRVTSAQSEALKERSMSFAVAILGLIDKLPRRPGPDVIARQLAKSATSVGANYRAACTARSRPEFVAKLCIVVEEAEECVYWLDLLVLAQILSTQAVCAIRAEAGELRAIFAKSLGTTRANLKRNPSNE